MSLYIEHYPNKYIMTLFPFPSEFVVDLNTSVKERINENEQLTNATALKILKEIKWKSDMLAFTTKPVLSLSLSVALLITSASIPVAGPLTMAANIFLCIVAGRLLGYAIVGCTTNGFLNKASQAFSEQSTRAGEYIKILEAAKEEMLFLF